jgi:hypothetical protein
MKIEDLEIGKKVYGVESNNGEVSLIYEGRVITYDDKTVVLWSDRSSLTRPDGIPYKAANMVHFAPINSLYETREEAEYAMF